MEAVERLLRRREALGGRRLGALPRDGMWDADRRPVAALRIWPRAGGACLCWCVGPARHRPPQASRSESFVLTLPTVPLRPGTCAGASAIANEQARASARSGDRPSRFLI